MSLQVRATNELERATWAKRRLTQMKEGVGVFKKSQGLFEDVQALLTIGDAVAAASDPAFLQTFGDNLDSIVSAAAGEGEAALAALGGLISAAF